MDRSLRPSRMASAAVSAAEPSIRSSIHFRDRAQEPEPLVVSDRLGFAGGVGRRDDLPRSDL
jgi:hypothetical protein